MHKKRQSRRWGTVRGDLKLGGPPALLSATVFRCCHSFFETAPTSFGGHCGGAKKTVKKAKAILPPLAAPPLPPAMRSRTPDPLFPTARATPHPPVPANPPPGPPVPCGT